MCGVTCMFCCNLLLSKGGGTWSFSHDHEQPRNCRLSSSWVLAWKLPEACRHQVCFPCCQTKHQLHRDWSVIRRHSSPLEFSQHEDACVGEIVVDGMFGPTPIRIWGPNLQCVGVWRWGFWRWLILDEVTREVCHDGISALTRRNQSCRAVLLPLRTQTKGGSWLQARKRTPARNWIGWHLDLGLPASRTVRNKCVLFQPPSLWHFVVAAWED